MLMGLIGLLALVGIGNIVFHEFRVSKFSKEDPNLVDAYLIFKRKRK